MDEVIAKLKELFPYATWETLGFSDGEGRSFISIQGRRASIVVVVNTRGEFKVVCCVPDEDIRDWRELTQRLCGVSESLWISEKAWYRVR